MCIATDEKALPARALPTPPSNDDEVAYPAHTTERDRFLAPNSRTNMSIALSPPKQSVDAASPAR